MTVPAVAPVVEDEVLQNEVLQNDVLQDEMLQQQNEQLETIVDILTPTEEEIELQQEAEKLQQEIFDEQLELLRMMGEDLDELVTVLSEENESDLTETMSTNELLMALSEKVEQMNTLVEEKSLIVDAASSTVVGYGVLYVPLLLIVVGGWWFFKQFLTDFR